MVIICFYQFIFEIYVKVEIFEKLKIWKLTLWFLN